MRAVWEVISISYGKSSNSCAFSFNRGKVLLEVQSLKEKRNPHFFHIFNIKNFLFCHGSVSGEEVLKNPLQLFVPFHLRHKNS